MSAYVVVEVNVLNKERYEAYNKLVPASLKALRQATARTQMIVVEGV